MVLTQTFIAREYTDPRDVLIPYYRRKAMKQRGWMMLGGAALLGMMTMQAAMAHDDDWRGYGPPKGMPGYSGPGYGDRDCDGPNFHGFGHHGMKGHDVSDGLDLSDEQESAIRKILHEARKDFRKVEDKITEKRHALYDLIDDGKSGKETDKLASEIGDLMAERIKLRVALREKINKQLTPEQRDEAEDMPFFGRGMGSWYY